MTKLTGETLNIEEENIQKIKELFPEVDTDGKIDFDKLKQLLGDYAEDSDERYNFTWNGKGEALRISQTPSMGTLRPAPEESKNWDETENLYIEGDNLEVLKLLQKSYFEKIKMIYIDPPYNTGGDFVYKDNFKDNIKNYKEITGQIDSEGQHTTTNREYSGRYHTDWLNMMYPRLRLARNLLTDDGVIFISIDDHEAENLKKVCNEVFGENNFIGTIIRKVMEGGKSDSKGIAIEHEYCHVYIKSNLNGIYQKRSEKMGHYNQKDEHFEVRGYYYLKPLENGGLGYVESLDYPIIGPDGKEIYPGDLYGDNGYRWVWNKKRYERALEMDMIDFRKSRKDESKFKVYYKIYENMNSDGEIITRRLPYGTFYLDGFTNRQAINDVKKTFENTRIFDYPKPVSFIKEILGIGTNINDIILDFFSGSSTTAHAVMDVNAEDNGNRKFIMIQLPEETDKKSEAYKAGYENIAEIGKERIRRAGDQIKDELTEKYESASEEERKEMKHPDDLDIGFKTFKLDSSNIKEWNPGLYDDVQMAIEDSLTPYVEGRTEEDVVYEMILKMGLDLTYPVEEYEVNGKTIYSVGYGFLMISLADEIDLAIAEKMIEIKDEYQPEEFRVIFRDEGFRNDTDKTNIKETLRSAGLAEEAFITL